MSPRPIHPGAVTAIILGASLAVLAAMTGRRPQPEAGVVYAVQDETPEPPWRPGTFWIRVTSPTSRRMWIGFRDASGRLTNKPAACDLEAGVAKRCGSNPATSGSPDWWFDGDRDAGPVTP